MSRFIIADLTDPSSIPEELEAIVPQLAVPVQPLIEGSSRPYAMFKDYWKYDWVLPAYRCATHGVDDAAELDEVAVASAFDDTPVMHSNGGIDEIATEAPQAGQGAIQERFFRRRGIGGVALQQDVAARAMQFGFERAIAQAIGRRQRFIEDRNGAILIARGRRT